MLAECDLSKMSSTAVCPAELIQVILYYETGVLALFLITRT